MDQQLRLGVDRLTSISWECVHFTTDKVDSILEHFERSGSIQLFRMDAQTAPSLMEGVANALHFPTYFGHNWDAMDECMRDLSWLEFGGLVLMVENAGGMWEKSTCDAGMFLGIWLSAAEKWASEGKPFHLVFHVESEFPRKGKTG